MCLEISVSVRASSQELLRVSISNIYADDLQHPFILKAGTKDDMKRLIRRTKQIAKQKEVDDRETMQKLFG